MAPGRMAVRAAAGDERAMTRERRKSVVVQIGGVRVGGANPIVVQSMTNTDTADVAGTARQVQPLARAGSELVRITVNTAEAAAAVPQIRERLAQLGVNVPLIGDFHFNGHKLLREHPGCAEALAKYRINPGNVGRGSKRDSQFAEMIEIACRYDKPVRIGVNWGSLDQELLARLMDENSPARNRRLRRRSCASAIVRSALERRARHRTRPAARSHHPVGQGQRRAGSDRDLQRSGRALRLPAAPGAHRGRHGLQGHRGLDRRHGGRCCSRASATPSACR